MNSLLSRSSGVLCLQESAKKLEQNVNLFGSTVESLLYRYGKVIFDWVYILEKQLWEFPAQMFTVLLNKISICFKRLTVEICSYLPVSVSEAVLVCSPAAPKCSLFLPSLCFCNHGFPKEAISLMETGQLSRSLLPVSIASILNPVHENCPLRAFITPLSSAAEEQDNDH